MRFPVVLVLFEVVLLGLVIAISRTRLHEEAVRDAAAPAIFRQSLGVTQRHADDAFVVAFQTARDGLDRHLSAAQKAAALTPGLVDAIFRMEGMFDPTRVGLFGPAMRMEVRPGTASMAGVFGERWLRISPDPNLHRHVHIIATGWAPRRGLTCADFWMFRREDGAVMLDNLTPGECRRLAHDSRAAPPVPPIVSARLSLPAFTAPYPGNRVSHDALRAEQQTRIQAALQARWFRRRSFSPILGGSSMERWALKPPSAGTPR